MTAFLLESRAPSCFWRAWEEKGRGGEKGGKGGEVGRREKEGREGKKERLTVKVTITSDLKVLTLCLDSCAATASGSPVMGSISASCLRASVSHAHSSS